MNYVLPTATTYHITKSNHINNSVTVGSNLQRCTYMVCTLGLGGANANNKLQWGLIACNN